MSNNIHFILVDDIFNEIDPFLTDRYKKISVMKYDDLDINIKDFKVYVKVWNFWLIKEIGNELVFKNLKK